MSTASASTDLRRSQGGPDRRAAENGELRTVNGLAQRTPAIAAVEVPPAIPSADLQSRPIPRAEENAESVIPFDLEIIEDEIVFDGISIVEDESVLSPEAVAVVSELSGTERPKNAKLSVELLGDSKFKGGDRGT